MKKLRRSLAFLLIAVMAVIFPAQTVMAAFKEITCDNAGIGTGGLYDPNEITNQSAQGPIDPNNPCGLVGVNNIFSSIGCHYIIILNDVFSKFFCALQFGMRDMMVAVVTLFVIVYGVRLLIGTQEATGGAAILAFIKIGIVFMFMDKGALAVSYVYKFFIAFIEESVAWVFAGINCPFIICVGNAKDVSDVFADLDQRVKTTLMGYDNGGTNTGGLFTDNGELIMFFFALTIVALPLFFIVFNLIKTAVAVFVKSLVTFMLSITAVAFLISLSPIFMSFMLFNSTYSLFDNWVRFLVSYSLQPMIIFAIFSLWIIISADFLGFIADIGKIIVVVPKNSIDKAAVLTIKDTLAFCPLYFPPDNSSSITGSGPSGLQFPFTFNLGGPTVKCCQLVPKTGPVVDLTPDCVDPGTAAITPDQYLLNIYPYEVHRLQEPQAVLRDGRFAYYLGYHLVALLAIASAFFHLIEMTPQIAQALSRSQAAMPLGAGFGGGGGLSSMISRATDTTRKTAGKATDRLMKMSTQRGGAGAAGPHT